MASATSVKLDDAMKERVRHLAEARKRTSHWIMREAISQYVEREEKREALRRDTLRAWEEFRETGRHATAEEVDAWLRSGEPRGSFRRLNAASSFCPGSDPGPAAVAGISPPEKRRCGAQGRPGNPRGGQILGSQPRLGRMVEDLPEEFREWLIDFGDSGYVVRYRIGNDAITVLKVRHQKEVGYD